MSLTPHDPEEFDDNLPPVTAIEAQVRVLRGRRVAKVVSGFIFGQGAAQGMSVLAGLFLVRKLSVEAYAQFGLASGFQTVFSVLMDLGFASTIIPLVGDRRDDPALIGRYVRSAKHLRDRSFWLLAPVAAIAFLAIVHRHHWSWTVQLLLLGSVLVSLYSVGKVAYFSAPLFVFGRLREYYVPQVVTGAVRVLAYVGLAFAGSLNAWTAAGLIALTFTFNASFIQRASRKLLTWPTRDDPATDREMVKYILPASPAIIFSAFQSQISLFLVGIFGGTINIAEVTALSRIGQLFALLLTFHVVVTEPYIARQPRAGLMRTFALFLLAGTIASVPAVLIAFVWPQVFIFIIGGKYEAIRGLMGWYVLSCCMNLVAGLMWIMNRARKWVFWSGSIVEVGLVLGTQLVFLALVGVHTTQQAVHLAVASSFCYLAAHGYVTVYGFWKGDRRIAAATA